MKIIQFVPTLGNGGGETLVRDYAVALKKKGHDVRVLVGRDLPEASNEKIVKANKIPLVALEAAVNKKRCFIIERAFTAYGYLRLIKYLNEEKPDIVHVHLTLLHILHVCRRFIPAGIRIIYTCHSVPEIYFKKYRKEFSAVKYFLKRGNFVLIGLHEEAAAQMKEMFQSPDITYLHNMIDLKRFRNPAVSKEDMRRQLGISQDAFVIGHVGRFVEVKNHDFLIKIFGAVIKEKPNAFLLMIGEGELKAAIEAKLNDMGFADKYLILSNRSDIPELDHAMDVCVFPSKHEGFLIAVLEAQACGVKCVCSRNIPSAVFINKNVYALSLDDSTEHWKDAILYDDMPQNISSNRLGDYGADVIINKLEQIYRGQIQ
ncbi:MAG: glycosyltransferase [Clostridiales bacterium]|nr:glycosyltransferase [Clostridiales bacterium]